VTGSSLTARLRPAPFFSTTSFVDGSAVDDGDLPHEPVLCRRRTVCGTLSTDAALTTSAPFARGRRSIRSRHVRSSRVEFPCRCHKLRCIGLRFLDGAWAPLARGLEHRLANRAIGLGRFVFVVGPSTRDRFVFINRLQIGRRRCAAARASVTTSVCEPSGVSVLHFGDDDRFAHRICFSTSVLFVTGFGDPMPLGPGGFRPGGFAHRADVATASPKRGGFVRRRHRRNGVASSWDRLREMHRK